MVPAVKMSVHVVEPLVTLPPKLCIFSDVVFVSWSCPKTTDSVALMRLMVAHPYTFTFAFTFDAVMLALVVAHAVVVAPGFDLAVPVQVPPVKKYIPHADVDETPSKQMYVCFTPGVKLVFREVSVVLWPAEGETTTPFPETVHVVPDTANDVTVVAFREAVALAPVWLSTADVPDMVRSPVSVSDVTVVAFSDAVALVPVWLNTAEVPDMVRFPVSVREVTVVPFKLAVALVPV
jgi:hypothetical protein